MRIRAIVAVGVALVVIAGLGVYLGARELGRRLPLPGVGRTCTVQADGRVSLSPEQMANAATIAAIGVRRKMPQRAVEIALATAFQESRLKNLSGGDRDSVGLFQQRPSQGWGTPEQIRDPRYAANRFYAALKKVRGWERMRITDAAQAVQRSAFPEAYQQWADESAVLTRALLGEVTGAVACTVGRRPAVRGVAAAAALNQGLALDWGLDLRAAGPAALASTELDVVTLPAAEARIGWRYAHWLVSYADDHGVKRVRFGGLEWTADEGDWSPVSDDRHAPGVVIAEVFGDA